MCKKRANHLDIVCKCGQKFCMEHRQPESHKCTFDFKNFGRKRLDDATHIIFRQGLVAKLDN